MILVLPILLREFNFQCLSNQIILSSTTDSHELARVLQSDKIGHEENKFINFRG